MTETHSPPSNSSATAMDDNNNNNNSNEPRTLHISDHVGLAAAWQSPRPILTHLNADTTWVLHLPYPKDASPPPPPGRTRYNVLLDPWLQGPQSDGGRWFSIQWHVVAPGVSTIAELNSVLGKLERHATTQQNGEAAKGVGEAEEKSYIDVVAISHEFTDHCHEATLRELPASTPVFAPDKAAALIRSWKHFEHVIETPAFRPSEGGWRTSLLNVPANKSLLAPWVGIGRVVTAQNALYYHSAIVVAWNTNEGEGEGEGEAIVYSPHGIKPEDLSALRGVSSEEGGGLRVLALLHGLDDVRLWMTKQLNLGAVNGVAAARACGARYWVATHDEVKRGGGFISLLLRRTTWSVADAVRREGEKGSGDGEKTTTAAAGYKFVELGSGDAMVLD